MRYTSFFLRHPALLAGCALSLGAGPTWAQNLASDGPVASPATTANQNKTARLPDFVIEGEAESDHTVQGPFLPDVQGTKINAGKKTTVLDFDNLPRINSANYRQALIQTPGLILSEENTPLLSIGYRGLPPGRTQYTQVLTDGIPIHADQFGYPEAYYVPPLETVDRLEFIRGGASLMYGPQPGGALNYVTHRPRTDRQLSGATENTFGDDNTWNSFTHLDGTTGRVGYYGYFNHRESDGFQAFNSDMKLNSGYLKLALDATGPNRLFATVETYREEHGEPGGLTFATGPNTVNYAVNRNGASRAFDRFELDRDAVTLSFEHDQEAGLFTAKAWAVDYARRSHRQLGGGFGTTPTGAASATNDIENQEFKSFGAEVRQRLDWGADSRHVLSFGGQLYLSDSPRTDSRGTTASATSGVAFRQSQRDLFYAPLFAENLFRFGDFSLTPGVRVENFRQTVETRFFDPVTGLPDPVTPRRSGAKNDSVPLLGLGAAYDVTKQSQIYANVSQAYRPFLFTESIPNSTTNLVAGDLESGSSWQTDLGYRIRNDQGFAFDASVFYMLFKDKIGGSGTAPDPIRNVGRVEYFGAELSGQYDLLRLWDGDGETQLNLLANLTLLDAEITKDSVPARIGNSPAFAPHYIARSGLVFNHKEETKIAFLGTFNDASFADDAHTANRFLPGYMVWDVTAEIRLGKTPFTALLGVNNVFNEDYYSRITNTGIDPAPARNYYIGLKAEF